MFPQSPVVSGKKRKTRTMDIGSPGMKTLGRQSKRHLTDRSSEKEWREKSASFGKKRASMIVPSFDENQSNNSPSRYHGQKRHSINAFPPPGLDDTFGLGNNNNNKKKTGLSLPPLADSKQCGRDLMSELEKAQKSTVPPSPQASALPPKLQSTSLPASIASPLPAPLASPSMTPTTPSALPASIASPLPAPLSSPAITPLPPPISSLSNPSPLPSPFPSPLNSILHSCPQSPLPAPLSLDVPASPSKPPAKQLPGGITSANTAPMRPPFTSTTESPNSSYLRKRRGSAPVGPTLSMMGGAPTPVFPLAANSSSSENVTPKPKPPPLPALSTSSEEVSPAEAKRLRKLARAKNELYETEKTYHDILHSLVYDFLVPLRELVPTSHLDKLFGNVVELYGISTAFLGHFQAWVSGEVPSLCQVFEEKGRDLLNAMIAYCDRFSFLQQRNFKLIVEGVDPSSPNAQVDHAYKKTSAAITAFLKSKKVAAQDLNSKLVVPCQRVMRYRMLVEEIKKNSCVNKDREMYNDLQKLVVVAQLIADEVNKYMSKLAQKHKCHQITEEFAARFENGEEFVVTMENDLAAIQAEADVVILEPNTAFDFDNDDSAVSFQYPTRQLTGKSSRPVYLLKSGLSSKCVLEETKEHVALLGSKLVRATGGKKNMTIEEIVSLDYGFYVRGEEDNQLHILTPYSDFVLQFGSEKELLGWTVELDRMFEELEDVVKRKRKRHARKIAFYRFGGCMVGSKAVNRPFMLVWMDMDESDVPYPKDCGLKNVKRVVRGGEKEVEGPMEEDEDEDAGMDDNEIEVIRSPVRKLSLPGSPLPGSPARPMTPQQQQGQDLGGAEGGEDPSVVAMYAQLRLIEEQHRKNPMGNYKSAIALSRVAIINRKKMLMEFDGTPVTFTEEEKEWEKDMVVEEGGMGGGSGMGTPKFKRFLPKCNMPKASPSLKRVRKGW